MHPMLSKVDFRYRIPMADVIVSYTPAARLKTDRGPQKFYVKVWKNGELVSSWTVTHQPNRSNALRLLKDSISDAPKTKIS